jgi:hypothetical protein
VNRDAVAGERGCVRRGRRSWLVVVAVAVAVAAGCGDDDPARTTAATTEATAGAPSTAPAPLPVVACCDAEPIAPGRYALPAGYAPLATVDVPSGWAVTNDVAARYLAFGQEENEVGTPLRTVTLYRGAAGDRDATLAAIVASADLDVLAVDETAGFVDAAARANPGFAGSPGADIAAGTRRLPALAPFVAQGFAVTTSSPEARLRFSLRTEGELLLVSVVEAPAPSFDAFAAAADELLAGLH